MGGSKCCKACQPVFSQSCPTSGLGGAEADFPALLRAVRAAEADDLFDSNFCPEHGLHAYVNS